MANGQPDQFDDAIVDAVQATIDREITRTKYNLLRRCRNAMNPSSKALFDEAMRQPVIEDGDGIFNENGYRIG